MGFLLSTGLPASFQQDAGAGGPGVRGQGAFFWARLQQPGKNGNLPLNLVRISSAGLRGKNRAGI